MFTLYFGWRIVAVGISTAVTWWIAGIPYQPSTRYVDFRERSSYVNPKRFMDKDERSRINYRTGLS